MLDGRNVLRYEETSKLRENCEKSGFSEGKKKLVLDMKNVKMIDSSGLGAWSLPTPAPVVGRSRSVAAFQFGEPITIIFATRSQSC